MSADKDLAVQLWSLKTSLALEHGIDLDGRSLQLVGPIDDEMFRLVDSALNLFEPTSKGSVTLKINSEGGSVYSALAIVGRMKASKCHIVTEGYGCIMSAAGLILAAGEKRCMSSMARFMYHEMSTIIEGNVSQLRYQSQELVREQELWAELMAKFSKKSSDFWLANGSSRDLYLGARECVEYGLVDKIF